MFLGQLKSNMFKEEKEPSILEKPPESLKSPNAENFIKTHEAKQFVESWRKIKAPDGTNYTRRGLISFLQLAYQASGNKPDKEIVNGANEIIKQMHGKDSFFAAFGGLKAKSEGLVKGLKSALGFK